MNGNLISDFSKLGWHTLTTATEEDGRQTILIHIDKVHIPNQTLPDYTDNVIPNPVDSGEDYNVTGQVD